MKQENRRLLDSVASDSFRVWDFIEAHDFDSAHFRDGDHLNLYDAERLMAQLAERGLML